MSEFSHLKNKLLAEQVEDQIYHYILDEALEPGAKLPNEFALGEKFRVGRSTIREAVKLLSSKGIVEVRQGSGTYVVTTVKGLSDPLNLRSVQDKNALAFDLVNVRLLLEPGIAEMAAQNATPEDIERLRRLCERVETKIHEGDRYIEDDIAFHTCIAESSKNLVVGQLIPVIDTAALRASFLPLNFFLRRAYTETAIPHANGEYEKFGFPSQLHFPPVRDIVSPTQCSLHTAAGDTLTAALFLSSACMHKSYCATGFP